MNKNHPVIATLILSLTSLVFLFFSYPGFMTADSFHQLNEATAGVFTSDQAPVMSWLWSRLLWLSPQQAPQLPLLLLHTFGIVLGLFLFLDAFYPKYKLRNALYTSFIVFYPPILGLIGNIWKDIGLVSSWLLSLGLIAQVSRQQWKFKSTALILALLSMCYGIAARHNAPLAAWPLVYWALNNLNIKNKKFHKLKISLVITLLLFASSFIFSKIITGNNDKSFVHKYTLFDLAGISVFSGDIVLPKYDDSKDWTVEELKKIYTPKSNVALSGYAGQRGLSAPRNSEESRATLGLWLKAVLKHPGAYLYHRYKVSASLLGLTTWQEYPYYVGIQESNPPNHRDLKLHESSLRTTISGIIEKLSQSPLFRAYLYLIIIFLILWMKRKSLHEKSQLIYVSLSMSALLNTFTLCIMTGAADFRYNLWTMLCALLILFLFINENTQRSRAT